MRRILLTCVLVQVLLGALASKIYLTQHNTLHANGKWVSTKTRLERGLMGSFAFITERQSLAGGVLNLGAWHGFQEIIYGEPVAEIESLEFDLRLTRGGDLVALFDRDSQGNASGVRFGTVPRHPSAFLGITPEGEFRKKKILHERRVEPDVWHHAHLEFDAGQIVISLDGRKLGSFAHQPQPGRRFGFRGGSQKPIFVDNIEIALAGGETLAEDFNAPKSVLELALGVSAALIALNWGLYFLLARLTRRNEHALGFSFLMVNLTMLAIGGLLFVFVLLRAGSYPGLGRALTDAEETFGRGTAEQVVADIRRRHSQRTAPPDTNIAAESVEPYRILFLGTSQTWGAGAQRDDEAFVVRSEALLNATAAGGRKFECINAGFSSLRAKDLVPILQRDLLSLEPQLLILSLSTNDRATRQGFASSVREMAEIATRADIRTVLVKEANEPGSMDRGQRARFADLDSVGAELGLPVIDMHGHLQGLQDTGFLWWDLVHLTSYGQRLVAEKLVEEIKRLEEAEPTRRRA